MDGRHYHNLVWVPMFLVGLSALMLGLVYSSFSTPWLLDKKANELLLGVSYTSLFSQSINQNLSSYLLLIYRFFGWWLVSIGLLISSFVYITKMGTPTSRNTLHLVTFFVLLGIYRIEYTFIPSSPFLWLTHALSFMLFLSIFGSLRLKKYD